MQTIAHGAGTLGIPKVAGLREWPGLLLSEETRSIARPFGADSSVKRGSAALIAQRSFLGELAYDGSLLLQECNRTRRIAITGC